MAKVIGGRGYGSHCPLCAEVAGSLLVISAGPALGSVCFPGHDVVVLRKAVCLELGDEANEHLWTDAWDLIMLESGSQSFGGKTTELGPGLSLRLHQDSGLRDVLFPTVPQSLHCRLLFAVDVEVSPSWGIPSVEGQ
jgi:hypothetical protein